MSDCFVYAGAFNRDEKPMGVKAFRFSKETAKFEPVGRYGNHPCLSNIVTDGDIMITCSEGPDAESLVSFRILPDGTLQEICVLKTGANLLAHLSIDRNRKKFLVSSMGSAMIMLGSYDENGELAVLDRCIFTDEGSCKAGRSNNPRQMNSRLHSAFFMPDGMHVQACNLGSDKVYTLEIDDENNKLKLLDELTYTCEGGSGPRHIAYSADGKYAYVNTEMSSEVYVFRIAGDASMELIQKINTLDPNGESESQTSITLISSDGKYYFCGNRGQNNLVKFSICGDGTLKTDGFYDVYGKAPRGMTFGPDETCILFGNNASGTITVVDYDKETGTPGECLQIIEGVTGAANVVVLQ